MNPSIIRYQRLSIVCGLLFLILFFIALLPLAGFIPPPSPTLSGEQLLAKYQEQSWLIKLAMPVGILSAGLSIPWNALIAGHIARIEGRDNGMPLLAITSFGAGAVNTVLFLLPFILWAGIFYRPDPDPDAFRIISDMAWLEVVMLFSPACIQMITIALAGFMDKDKNPVFPRWICYAMIWLTLLTIPGSLGIFFYKGPFAWNGIIVFWLPATAFGLCIQALAYVMYKHTKIHEI